MTESAESTVTRQTLSPYTSLERRILLILRLGAGAIIALLVLVMLEVVSVPMEKMFLTAWIGVIYVGVVEGYAAIRRFLWQIKPPAMIVRDAERERAREE